MVTPYSTLISRPRDTGSNNARNTYKIRPGSDRERLAAFASATEYKTHLVAPPNRTPTATDPRSLEPVEAQTAPALSCRPRPSEQSQRAFVAKWRFARVLFPGGLG